MIPPTIPVPSFNYITPAFLSGGGQMGQLMREVDWSKTVLGPACSWPQSLRTTLSILLASKFPMFLYWGPQLVFFYNDAFRPSLGNESKHAGSLGKPGGDFWPEAWAGLQPVIEQVLAGGEATWNEDQLIPNYCNGKVKDVYWTYNFSPLLDESGQPGGVLVTCQEITQQVINHQQLAQSKAFAYHTYRENDQTVGISPLAFEVTGQVEARREADQQRELLHTLFMKAPVPIVILDGSELVYQLVNPAYQQIFPGRELLGKPLLKALPELAGTDIPAILSRVYQTGETFVARELPLMLARYQGGPLEKIYWTFTYQARHNDRGRVDGVLVFAHEVTDQVQSRQVVEVSEQQAQALAQELAASNEELQAANEQVRASNENLGQVNTQLQRTNVDLDTFIYTASHDLKAPIANIEGLMKILLRQLPAESLQAEPVQETISFIQDSVSRFKRTIANLTEVVKLQKEADQPTVDVDLASITRAVLLDLALQIGESGAQVIVEVSHCTKVSFTEKNLRSVLYNLLSNAIKYRSPDRNLVVQIYCQPSGGYKLLTVADNGMGMDLERRHKLFSMFQRFHDHVEGSGIGLYMVKRMIENAGGKIEVESQVGVGSSFRVYFTRYD